MSSSTKFRHLLALAAAAMLYRAPAAAQQDFREASGRALSLAQAGKWNEAETTARKGLDTCSQAAAGKDCRALLNYSLGFILQKQGESSADPAERNRATNAAVRFYQSSLVDDPDNAAVQFNLALLLEKSGDSVGAINLLQSAIHADPSGGWLYAVKLGDLYASEQKVSQALDAYQQAAKSAPSAEGPRWRILDFSRRGYIKSAPLEANCKSWELQFPALAAACYEQVIRASSSDDATLAEQAFLAWVTLLAENERLTVDSLNALPNEWNPAVVASLRGYLGAVEGRLPGADWWLGSPARRQAVAAVLLAAGHRAVLRGPEAVQRCWMAGLDAVRHLRVTAPGSNLAFSPPVALDLYRELALLYIRYPRFDPDQRKLNFLIQDLFEQKGEAIQSNDLEAEQRFHMVLGMIFVEQKVWGVDRDPHGAAFQLRRAVEVAGQRYQAEGFYQPLPEIKELRARVYTATAEPEKAKQSLWDAALAYMDSDELERADRILDALPADSRWDKQSLKNILALRHQASGAPGTADPVLAVQYQSLQERPGIPGDFLKRQQFKILADVVANSSRAASQTDLQHAMDALDLAAEQHVPLVGMNDLMRWEAVERKVVSSVGGQTRKAPSRFPGGAANTPLKLSLPGRTLVQEVEVSQQTARAAQITHILGSEAVLQLRPHLLYDGSKLAMPVGTDKPLVRQRLKEVGVTVVPR